MKRLTAFLGMALMSASAPVWAQATYSKIANLEYVPGGCPPPGTTCPRGLDLYVPVRGSSFPVVVLVHGNGWWTGDKSDANDVQLKLVLHLVNRGYAVAFINYRLASGLNAQGTPSGPFGIPPGDPDQIYDVKAAIRYLRAHALEHKLNPARVALMGASAGGHLALLSAYTSGVALEEDFPFGDYGANATFPSDVRAVVSVSGPTSLLELDNWPTATPTPTPTGTPTPTPRAVAPCYSYLRPTSALTAFMGCDMSEPSCQERAHEADPIHYVRSGLPPTALMHGTDDCAVQVGQSRLLNTALQAIGSPVSYYELAGATHSDLKFGDWPATSFLDRFLDRNLQPITWANKVEIQDGDDGNNLQRLLPGQDGYHPGWTAGAVSKQALLDGEGFLEFTADVDNNYRIIGFTKGSVDPADTRIDFGIELYKPNIVYFIENGGIQGQSTFQPNKGEHFRISVEDGHVKYYQNGDLKYTGGAPTYPLRVKVSLYDDGQSTTTTTTTTQNILLIGHLGSVEDVTWTSAGNVVAQGNSLVKAAPSSTATPTPTAPPPGWNAGAVSVQALLNGDGYVEFTDTETATDTYRILGLSHGSTGEGSAEIDFGIYLSNNQQVYITENGVTSGSGGATHGNGDKFRVAVQNGAVRYYKNGVPLPTPTAARPPLIYPLQVDTSIFNVNSHLDKVVMAGALGTIQPVTWTGAVNATPAGSTLAKWTSAGSGWNAGAVSTAALLEGDGGVEFKVTQPGLVAVGLSHGNADESLADIDFGLQLSGGATPGIFINEGTGNHQVSGASYTVNDVFRIAIERGIVKYYKNNVLLGTTTSTVAPAYPLRVDTSLSDTAPQLTNVNLFGTLGVVP